jgi:GR25 family glycosyltransferase involved in LPS biosynthesis
MVRTLVISMDSDVGKERLAKLNVSDYEVVQGVDGNNAPSWIKEKFHGRHKGEHRQATIGCFAAHVAAWEAAGKKAVIVLEDDAYCCRKFDEEALASCPADGVTLLGGVLRTPGTWDKESEHYIKSGEFLVALSKLKLGVNPLQQKFTMSLSYFLPAGVASMLLSAAKKAKSIGPVDAWMGKTGLVTSLYYPNFFMDSATTDSQIGSKTKEMKSDLYANEEMRKIAEKKFKFVFPPRGADVKLFTSEVLRCGILAGSIATDI